MKNINIRKIYYHVRHRYITMNNMVMVVALVVGAGWAWASVGAMQRNYALQKEVDAKVRDQKLLELETQNLAFQQKYYKSAEYQELALRERMGLARPNERMLLLPPNSVAAKEADDKLAKKATVREPDEANLQQWVNFIFGGNKQKLP